ncbi:MAG: hypothetical protein MUE96_06580 [Bacteroidia bacterium]|jgi:hypothetical protein|nr:hypothetical protein [Bacteroidia bacterium]
MTPLFKKLNFKNQNDITVLNNPPSFEVELTLMKKECPVFVEINPKASGDFMMAFATTQLQVDELAELITPKLTENGVLWFCYPKASSKKYKCDFNRDTGWAILGKLGFEPVRQVAIDEDWSALRFKRAEQIQKMTRSFAMTAEGKRKVSAAKK